MSRIVDKAHELTRRLDALFGIIRYFQAEQHVRKAHDAKTDFARQARLTRYLLERILIYLYDIIKEVNGLLYRITKQVVINTVFAVFVERHHFRKVYRTKIAALIRQKRLFSAWVRGLNLTNRRHNVILVQSIKEYYARLAVFPRHIDYKVEYFFCVERSLLAAVPRVDKVVFLVLLYRRHERFRQSDTYVKIRYLFVVALALYKLDYIGMVYSQYAHVGAATRTALLDGLRGGVKYLHKANGPRCYAAGRAHRRTFGAQA